MHKMMSFDAMQDSFKNARIIITHGGPSSFLEALQHNKIPIVVPRQKQFDEHVNNHQVDFVKLIDRRMNNIIPIYNIDDLSNAIMNFNEIVKNKNIGKNSNNKKFNENLEKIVNHLMEKN